MAVDKIIALLFKAVYATVKIGVVFVGLDYVLMADYRDFYCGNIRYVNADTFGYERAVC